jgi:hypothetical protein
VLGVWVLFAAAAWWAKTEPLPKHDQPEAECTYTEHPKDVRSHKPPSATIICVQRGGQDKEDYSERELRQGNLWALIPTARHWLHRAFRDPVAGFTGLLFISTVLLWLATERTIEHARGASKRELRAYVSAEIGGLTQHGPKQSPSANVKFSNHGKTPAINVSRHGYMLLVDKSINEIEAPKVADIVPTDQTLGPSATIGMNIKNVFSMTTQGAADFGTGDIVQIVVVGIVSYDDVFGDRHYTSFCHSYERTGSGSYVPQGNSAD